MTEPDRGQDRLIRTLAPRYDVPVSAADPRGSAAGDLLRAILLESRLAEPSAAAPRRPRWLSPRRLLIAAPTAAALAALIFVVAAVLPAAGPAGPAPAHALAITQTDGYIDIRILDPVADQARYQAELAAHGLDIELELIPTIPERVGMVIFEEVQSDVGPPIETIEAPGRCSADEVCAAGIRVPVGFQSSARVVFGREPQPGEYAIGSDQPPPAPGPGRSK